MSEIVNESGNRAIATVWARVQVGQDEYRQPIYSDDPEGIASAQLIASAPDLLAALERALDYIAHEGVPEDGEDVYEEGEQAIAKAKGQ
jgi:hypothetical protein